MNGDANNNLVNVHTGEHALKDSATSPFNKEYLNVNACVNKEFTYDFVKQIADWLLERISVKPKVAIVCGSGLGGIADRLEQPQVFPYNKVPNFPQSTVSGHKGNLIFGKLNGVDVVCMQGRFHTYEGYANALCTLPMKVFRLLGVKCILLTCAAGSVNPAYEIGDIMMIKDHLAIPLWSLLNPLVGHNDERFGPRFPAANLIYKKPFRDLFRDVAKRLGVDVKEGVYSATGGPSYETVTEARALRMLGADAVGMSVTHEAVVSNHCGMHIMGFALITNKVIMEYDCEDMPNHQEVLQIANEKAKDVEQIVTNFVKELVELDIMTETPTD